MKRFSPQDIKPENDPRAKQELEKAWEIMDAGRNSLMDGSVQVYGSTKSIADFIIHDLEDNGWFCASPYHISDQRDNLDTYQIVVFSTKGHRDLYETAYRKDVKR